MSTRKWPKPSIKLFSDATRASDDVQVQFDAFVELYREFADHFSSLDDDYRTQFVQSINDLFEDYNVGEAMTESEPDALKDCWSDLSSD